MCNNSLFSLLNTEFVYKFTMYNILKLARPNTRDMVTRLQRMH